METKTGAIVADAEGVLMIKDADNNQYALPEDSSVEENDSVEFVLTDGVVTSVAKVEGASEDDTTDVVTEEEESDKEAAEETPAE